MTCIVVNLQQSYEDTEEMWQKEKNIDRTFNNFYHPLKDQLGNNGDLVDMKFLFMTPQQDAILKAAEVCERTGKDRPSWSVRDEISYVWCKPKEDINGVDVVPVLCGFEEGYEIDVEYNLAVTCYAVMNRYVEVGVLRGSKQRSAAYIMVQHLLLRSPQLQGDIRVGGRLHFPRH